MDKKQIIAWLLPIAARLIAGYLTVKLGMDAAEADSHAGAIANAAGALVLAGVSIYTSVKGRKKLLAQEPPK